MLRQSASGDRERRVSQMLSVILAVKLYTQFKHTITSISMIQDQQVAER
jgi:hypothetical protein